MIKKLFNPLLGAITALLFIALSYYGLPLIDFLDGRIYDLEMSLSGTRESGKSNVVLIDIDDKSLKKLGQWPWPRHILAEMIDKLHGNGAKLIGLNIPLLDKESNQGLQEIVTFREKLDAYAEGKKTTELLTWTRENLEILQKDLDNDQILVNSIKRSGIIILPVFGRERKDAKGFGKDEVSVLTKNFLKQSKTAASPGAGILPRLTAMPFDAVAQAALGVGHGNVTFDRQMTVRTHPIFLWYKNSLLPSLPLRMAIASSGLKPSQVLAEPDRIQMKGNAIPLVDGRMLISYRLGRGALPRYSFADVLKSEKAPRTIKGRNIIIGFNSSESKHIPTPISSHMSENELAARILDNILNKDFIARPAFMVHLEVLAILLLGCFATFFFPKMRPLPRLAWTLGLAALTLAVSLTLFSMLQIWFKATYIGTFMIAVFFVFSVKQLFSGERVTQQSLETNRLLGLSFQSQGLLDLAFDKFQKLPLDNETKDLIYNLGLEYERKRMINKAIEAYAFVNKEGGFRDLDDRIPKLKDSDKSSTLGSHGRTKEPNILDEASSETVTKLGRYDILGNLGKGSMGLVYKALDPKINRLLAIKTIRFSEEFDADVISEIKERFFREAEIAGQLSHPSIVTIYDVGEHEDLTYMAMEFLEGHDLENYISKKTLLPFRKVLDIVGRVADALHYAHKHDVIHRDIKPANIMLLDSGGVKVTDFGIAKAISSSRTKTGVILGTPNYMSPEQIMGQKIDQRSDIFSLGVLFFQLLTGETPFHGDNLSSLLYQITQVKHPAVLEYNPKIPKVCEKIVDKALVKNPKARFKTAGEMAQYVKLLTSKLDQLMKKSPQ